MPSNALQPLHRDRLHPKMKHSWNRPPVTRASAEQTPTPPSAGPDGRPMSLHVSKLRGISFEVRAKLKRQGVTYTHQLLAAAGTPAARHKLAQEAGIEEAVLERLARRADLARIKGVGAIFADMLEILGVDHVSILATQDPVALHGTLHALNTAERFARRSPTPDEVRDWVSQAMQLPRLIHP